MSLSTDKAKPSGEHRFDDEVAIAVLVERGRRSARAYWADRRIAVRVIVVGLILGLVVAFGSTPEYTASIKILPYRAPGAGSGLSGLAGLAGVRIPSGTGDQAISADLYPEVAKTLDFRVAVAETPIRFSSLPNPVTPAQYFSEIARPSLLTTVSRYTVGLPRLVLSALMPERSSTVPPSTDSLPRLPYYDARYRAILESLASRLTTTSDKRTLVITMTGRMPDPYAAADLVRTASEQLMARLIEYESNKAAEQLRFIEQQAMVSKSRLDRVQRDIALLSDRTRGTVSATAQLESQRLQREYTLAFDVYRQFASEVEQARIKKAQDTPVFTILEHVVVPDTRSSPRRGRILVGALVLGVVASVAVVAARRMVIA